MCLEKWRNAPQKPNMQPENEPKPSCLGSKSWFSGMHLQTSMKSNKHDEIQFRKRLSQERWAFTHLQDDGKVTWTGWKKDDWNNFPAETNNSSPLKNHNSRPQTNQKTWMFLWVPAYFQAKGINIVRLHRYTTHGCERLWPHDNISPTSFPLLFATFWHENTCEVPIIWRSSNLFNKVQASLAPSVRKRWRNGVSNSASWKLEGVISRRIPQLRKKKLNSFHGKYHNAFGSAESNISGIFPRNPGFPAFFFVVGAKYGRKYVNKMLILLVVYYATRHRHQLTYENLYLHMFTKDEYCSHYPPICTCSPTKN